MKTLIAALAAVATVTAVAAPAVAQPYRGNDGWDRGAPSYRDHDRWDRGSQNIYAREADLQRRIDAGVRRGLLTRAEVNDLNYTLRQFHRSEANFRPNGLDGRERAALNRQLDWLEARLEGRLNNAAYARR